jgi:uncharacterized membrane protein (UPF0127 family)
MVRRRGVLRATVALLVTLLCAVTTGCSGEFGYRPPLSPIEITLDTDGKIKIKAERALVTPLGTFSFEAAVEFPDDGSTLLVIAHPVDDRLVQDRFRINSDETLGACLDGTFYSEFSNGRIYLQTTDETATIRVLRSNAAAQECSRTQRPAEPSGPENTIAVQVGEVTLHVFVADSDEEHRTGMIGWTEADLHGADGMLYRFDEPQLADPANREATFTFPDYRFDAEVHFFDADGQYMEGEAVERCSEDSDRCHPYYPRGSGGGVARYQYVLELIVDRLSPVEVGTPLSW